MELLPCQEDAGLRTLQAEVLECVPAADGFDVVLSRTPLYPEGGGQPSDGGTVGGVPVLSLRRREDGAVVHHLATPVSGVVDAVVDWVRRYDHMQQHTAQHLLTATLLDRVGWRTIAFHLGPDRSDVELDVDALPESDLRAMEAEVNARIREAHPVRVRITDREHMAELGVRSRRLPEGLTGPLRLIEIDGIDLNTCGGIHVANTSELQALKLLGTERISRGTRLSFIAGGRVLRELDRALERDRSLTRVLTCGTDEHLPAIERLVLERRATDKALKELRAQRAVTIGRDLARTGDAAVAFHSPQVDMDTLHAVANAAREARPDLLVLATAGDREGVFLVAGPEERVAATGPEVARILEGRGGGRGGAYQGKATRLDRRAEAEAFVGVRAGERSPQ
jgi:Ser-tRNA(Ala) deacylase AlaX